MKDVGQRTAEATALKHAVPYIRIFKGKTFVLKAGGGALEREATARALVEQIEVLHQVGIRVVLVHGGGTQSTELAGRSGAEARFVEGRRVTDAKALEVAAMVLNGAVNTHLLAVCRSVGLPAVGVSGVDAGLIQARKRPPVRVGGERSTSASSATSGRRSQGADRPHGRRLRAGGQPALGRRRRHAAQHQRRHHRLGPGGGAQAPRSSSSDRRAGDPRARRTTRGSLVSYTDLAGLRRLQGRAAGSLRGMLPKTSAIEAAIQGGVRRVHILSHEPAGRPAGRGIHQRGGGDAGGARTSGRSRPAGRRRPEAAAPLRSLPAWERSDAARARDPGAAPGDHRHPLGVRGRGGARRLSGRPATAATASP